MKNLKALFFSCLFAISFVSCDTNDELLVDPLSEFDAEILVTEDGIANNLNASIDVSDKHDLKVRVTYTSNDEAMRRLYITVDTCGRGAVPFKLILKDGTKVDLKRDGSIDLESKYKRGFDFQFDIKAPNDITDGTVVYKFWTTSGTGDFRDDTKRKKLEVSTITLNYGNRTLASQMKSFTTTQLLAPTADGKSKTFISLFDGKTYQINEGVELAALWDFGFFYGTTNQACLYSTSAYPLSIFKEDDMVSVIAKIKEEGIHETKFTLTSKDKAFFDGITPEVLSAINTSDITSQVIKDLEIGDVIEFVDDYGKKGYIYIVDMKKTYNSDGFIKIEVKIQS